MPVLVDENNVAHAIEKIKARKAAATAAAPTAAPAVVPDAAATGVAVPAASMAAAPVAPGPRASATVRGTGPTLEAPQVLGMPDWLAEGMPGGGLVRGQVSSMADCPAVVVDMLAHVTANGGCAAVVGYPNLALAAVTAAGGDLSRLVIVPDPAPHAAAVVATLAEGLDLVVYVPANRITPTFARPVEARLRKSNCALLSCGQAWPGARLNIDVQVAGVDGLGRGSGRIRSVGVTGRVWGKGQPPQRLTAQLTGSRGCVLKGRKNSAHTVSGTAATEAGVVHGELAL